MDFQETIAGIYAAVWWQTIHAKLNAYNKARLGLLPITLLLMFYRWDLGGFQDQCNSTGEILMYKARLIANGLNQVPGIYYAETYFPVIRIVMAIRALLMIIPYHLDIPVAYLAAGLQHEIYMRHPEGVDIPAGMYLLLLRAIYGLKQSGREWNNLINDFLVNHLGFTSCVNDRCVYVFKTLSNYCIICVYVDDIIVCTANTDLRDEIIKAFQQRFEAKCLGVLEWYLGIKVTITPTAIAFTMEKYIATILQKFGLSECRITNVPMATSVKLSADQSPSTALEGLEMKDFNFQSLIGVLQWIMLCVRPDIAFALSAVARFSANPGIAHWNAAVNIVRYLKGTPTLGITFHSGLPSLLHHAYADADWANFDIDGRRSQTGNIEMLSGGPIFWRSRVQKSVALSSTEAEYVSLTDMAKAIIPTKSTLVELFMEAADAPPTIIYQDNESTIRLAMYSTLHERTRHIDIRRHFIRELVEDKRVALGNKDTSDMVADMGTKALPHAPLVKCRNVGMGVHRPNV